MTDRDFLHGYRQKIMRLAIVAFVSFPVYSRALTFTEIQLTTNDVNEAGVSIESRRSGDIHVVYTKGTSTYYQCFFADGLNLIPEEFVSQGTSPSLALDPNGIPHVVCISTGSVMYAYRTNGTWSAQMIVQAEAASIDAMEDGNIYMAYATAYADGDGLTEIVLARIISGGLQQLSVLFDGADSSYSCYGTSAGQHLNYGGPVLRCSSGVIHVLVRRYLSKDSAYSPSGSLFCSGDTDARAAYARYENGAVQYGYSDASYYNSVETWENGLCIGTDGEARVTYGMGPAALYADALLSGWNEEGLFYLNTPYGISKAPTLEASAHGDIVIGLDRSNNSGTWLSMRGAGTFSPKYEITPHNAGREVDITLNTPAIAVIKPDTLGSNEVFLLLHLDSDDDGIEDGWEQEHYGGLTNATAGADSDLDNDSDLTEFIAATDPFDSNSFFRVESILSVSQSNRVAVSWSGRLSRSYALLASQTITGLWTGLPGHTNIRGENARITITNLFTNDEWNSYRLKTWLTD